MSRPTRLIIDEKALIHNVQQVRKHAPGKKIIAMVKADAYGCGLSSVASILENEVDAFGVACLEEAIKLRMLGSNKNCILFQGIFKADELQEAANHALQLVIHQRQQLTWLLNYPLSKPIKVWVKVNTGMNRLGFNPDEVDEVLYALLSCSWVSDEIGLMTHLGCADEPENPMNSKQLKAFNAIQFSEAKLTRSMANSAAILAFPSMHADVVRPGIMLYGVSPFPHKTGIKLGLKPVMRFVSSLSALHHYPANSPVGYGGTWYSNKPSIIGVVPVGYGDGYPRIVRGAKVWLNGCFAKVVGRVSMDMLTVDVTQCPDVKEGDTVELWGKHVPVETVAASSDKIAYELLCAVTPRVRDMS